MKLKENRFGKIKQTVKGPYYYSDIKSYFSDEEAIDACSRMSDPYGRGLADYKDKTNEEVKYRLHKLANDALEIYGGEILSLLTSLPRLKFKDKKAIELDNYFRHDNLPDFPVLTIKSSTAKFTVSFFITKDTFHKKVSDVRIYKSGTHIGSISKTGKIEAIAKDFKPHLSLFIKILEDGSYTLLSGVETGSCEICGRTLTHPLSVRLGIGPGCANNRGVNTSLYDFDRSIK